MLAALVPALGPPLCGLVLHLAYTPGHCVCAALLLLALTGMAFGVAGLIDADKAEIIVETGLYAQRRHLFLCGPHADGLQLAHPPSSLLTDTGAAQWSSVFLFSAVRLAAFFCAYIPIFFTPGTALGLAVSFVPTIPVVIPPLCFLLSTLVALGIVRSCMEMMLTLLATLLANTFFLVAALLPQAKAIRAIQTVWVTLPICASMLAFTRKHPASQCVPFVSLTPAHIQDTARSHLKTPESPSPCRQPSGRTNWIHLLGRSLPFLVIVHLAPLDSQGSENGSLLRSRTRPFLSPIYIIQIRPTLASLLLPLPSHPLLNIPTWTSI